MRRAAFLALLAGVAGCATGPCDPTKDKNIFQVAGCEVNGGYQGRLDAKQQDLADAEAAQSRAEAALAKAQGNQDRAVTEKARLQASLADQRVRSARLRNDIAATQSNTRLDQQKLAQLEQKMTELNAEEARLREAAAGGADVTAQVQALKQRQRAVEQQWDTLRRSAPTE